MVEVGRVCEGLNKLCAVSVSYGFIALLNESANKPQAQPQIVNSHHIWALGLLEQAVREAIPLGRLENLPPPYSRNCIEGDQFRTVEYGDRGCGW
jgi:hypothetical protein